MRLSFTITGPPVGKGRPRFVRATGRTYTPKRTLSYEDQVATAAQFALEDAGLQAVASSPVAVDLVAVFPRPNRLQRRKDPDGRMVMDSKAAGTDIDNVAKAVLDGMVKGGLMTDDKQVVRLTCWKLYAAKDEAPCTEVCVTDELPARGLRPVIVEVRPLADGGGNRADAPQQLALAREVAR